ncbi:MAG: hypothetical protein RLZZ70_836 [Candidatus Parcubacteria bacterium]|jgi:hypothetical protein
MKNILPLLADWANGIFAVLIAAQLMGVDPLWWHFFVGMVFSMSPDIDAVPELLARGKVASSAEHLRDHRTFLHYPIIAIPLGLLAWYSFGYFGLMWLIALCLHLLNDLYGTGWGLPLLYPVSKNNYKFFARRVNRIPLLLKETGDWNTVPAPEQKVRLVVSWTKAELPSYINKYGVDNWIRYWYMTVNPTAIIEYMLFTLAIVLMLSSLLY